MVITRFFFLLFSLFLLGHSWSALAVERTSSNLVPMYGDPQRHQKLKGFTITPKQINAAKGAVALGWRYFENNDHQTAMKRFNQAWLLDPEFGDAYHGFAILALMQEQDRQTAEAFFRKAIDARRKSGAPFVDYGLFLIESNRLDEAEHMLKSALMQDPRTKKVRANMALLNYAKNNLHKSCSWARLAKANGDYVDPGFVDDMCGR